MLSVVFVVNKITVNSNSRSEVRIVSEIRVVTVLTVMTVMTVVTGVTETKAVTIFTVGRKDLLKKTDFNGKQFFPLKGESCRFLERHPPIKVLLKQDD